VKKKERLLKLFKPDKQGKSRWVSVDEVIESGLSWTKNGNLRHGIAFGFDEVIWCVQRKNGVRSEVIALKMDGWNKADNFNQIITADIKNFFKTQRFCNLSLLRLSENNWEIDHRYGHKTHSTYVVLYKAENQKPEYFQLIHRALNQQKRQLCKECVDSGIRPAHPEKGFVEGGERLAGDSPCRGCYLAEPERYR
jgi:hypothetical protein